MPLALGKLEATSRVRSMDSKLGYNSHLIRTRVISSCASVRERSRPARVRMAASASDFASEPLGHAFVMRVPLAKVTARRCASCGSDIFGHARAEVSDEQLLTVLNVISEDKASAIVPGELFVGGFKAALGECKRQPQAVAVNCAGTKLHSFLPATREPFDALRRDGRVLDFEWDDSEEFVLPLADIVKGVTWIRAHVQSGRVAVVNCAQGKSRSGTMATACVWPSSSDRRPPCAMASCIV